MMQGQIVLGLPNTNSIQLGHKPFNNISNKNNFWRRAAIFIIQKQTKLWLHLYLSKS